MAKSNTFRFRPPATTPKPRGLDTPRHYPLMRLNSLNGEHDPVAAKETTGKLVPIVADETSGKAVPIAVINDNGKSAGIEMANCLLSPNSPA